EQQCTLGERELRLDETFSESGFTEDQRAIVILQRAGDDFRSGGGIAVDQHHDGIFLRGGVGLIGAEDLFLFGAATVGDYDLAIAEEAAGERDGFGDEAAAILAEIEDETFDVGFAKFL